MSKIDDRSTGASPAPAGPPGASGRSARRRDAKATGSLSERARAARRARLWRGGAAALTLAGAAMLLPVLASETRAPAEACARAADALTVHYGRRIDPREVQTRIGQMIMVGVEGTGPGEGTVERTRAMIRDGELGGVLLLGRNLGGPDEVRDLVSYLKPEGAPYVPFIAVDQEGGRVQRLKAAQSVEAIPSAARLGQLGVDEARDVYVRAARSLSEFGINVNLGPVVDLDVEPLNPIITRLGRSYGAEPTFVTELAGAFIDAHRSQDVATALKHFPGHGSSLADSHEGFVDITRTWDTAELLPFMNLADRADMIMTSHLYLADYAGPDGDPVSLSQAAIGDLLRDQVGFDGVVITDDLDMGAIAKLYDFRETVVRAVRADNDILLFAAPERRQGDKIGFVPVMAREAICEAIANDEIDYATIVRSFERLTALKQKRLS